MCGVCAVSVSEGHPIGTHECWLSVDEDKLCGIAGTDCISVSLCVALLPIVHLLHCARTPLCVPASDCVFLSHYACAPGSARIAQSALEIGTMKKEYIDTLW